MAGLYTNAIKELEQHMLQCPSKKWLGIDCPGCGMQRSMIALLRGDIMTCWRVYPPGVFISTTVMFLMLHLIFGFKHGAFILKFLYIVSATAIVANYIYKIYTKQIFDGRI